VLLFVFDQILRLRALDDPSWGLDPAESVPPLLTRAPLPLVRDECGERPLEASLCGCWGEERGLRPRLYSMPWRESCGKDGTALYCHPRPEMLQKVTKMSW
jgi:hypothetical protein